MTVLVSYASKHGATTEIAEALGRDLCARGVDAEVRSADEVDGVSRYDAVVLGSAIYMGKWLPDALRVAEQCDGRQPWLFSSGPIAGAPVAPPPDVRVAARDHRVFGGKLDRGSLSFAERAITRFVKAPDGDYRDFAAVAAYADTIAQSIASFARKRPSGSYAALVSARTSPPSGSRCGCRAARDRACARCPNASARSRAAIGRGTAAT